MHHPKHNQNHHGHPRHHRHHWHGGHHPGQLPHQPVAVPASQRASVRVEVHLNGDAGVNDFFRISLNADWEDFFDRVKTSLCPELSPEHSDCIRDARGAQVFETEVINDGEILYFCPRGERLRTGHHHHPHPHPHHEEADIDHGADYPQHPHQHHPHPHAHAHTPPPHGAPNEMPNFEWHAGIAPPNVSQGYEPEGRNPLRLSLVAAAASSYRGHGLSGSPPPGYPPRGPAEPLSFPAPDGSHPEIVPQPSGMPRPEDTIHFPTPDEAPVFDITSPDAGGCGGCGGGPEGSGDCNATASAGASGIGGGSCRGEECGAVADLGDEGDAAATKAKDTSGDGEKQKKELTDSQGGSGGAKKEDGDKPKEKVIFVSQ